MSEKSIRECDGKKVLSRWMIDHGMPVSIGDLVHVGPDTNLDNLPQQFPWLTELNLVVKPDQLIKRRGKSGLIGLNLPWNDAFTWIQDRRGRDVEVDNVTGRLDHFLIEPFLAHEMSDEYYVCIISQRNGDDILFHHEGGVDVGDVDSKALRLTIPMMSTAAPVDIRSTLLKNVPEHRRESLAVYIAQLYSFFTTLHFTYLEINPLVVSTSPNGKHVVTRLDLAAKVDEAALFECNLYWGNLAFPPPFGKTATPEEAFIADLDAKTGSSLKLTILNPKGRIWTMVAGGGASVIYADTIADLGHGHELANYGEYSGAPSESLTYHYAKTILKLMTCNDYKHEKGKILLIGGGIANFTNVAETFKGIVRALTEFKPKLHEYGVSVYVRRAGPNFQEGLQLMRDVGTALCIPIHVFGPETHMTSIVAMSLGKPCSDVNFCENSG
eukprot:26176_1